MSVSSWLRRSTSTLSVESSPACSGTNESTSHLLQTSEAGFWLCIRALARVGFQHDRSELRGDRSVNLEVLAMMRRRLKKLSSAQLEFIQFVWAIVWLGVFLFSWLWLSLEGMLLTVTAIVTLAASVVGGSVVLELHRRAVNRERERASILTARVTRECPGALR